MNARRLSFVLPFATESLNVRDRKHWAQRHRAQDQMQLEVIAALGGTRYLPRPPFAYARITVVRCSSGHLDPDNLAASVKSLVDTLCVRSATHPRGLGIIDDDSPRHIELRMLQSGAPRGAGTTVVGVIEMEAPPDLKPIPSRSPRGPALRRGGLPPEWASVEEILG